MVIDRITICEYIAPESMGILVGAAVVLPMIIGCTVFTYRVCSGTGNTLKYKPAGIAHCPYDGANPGGTAEPALPGHQAQGAGGPAVGDRGASISRVFQREAGIAVCPATICGSAAFQVGLQRVGGLMMNMPLAGKPGGEPPRLRCRSSACWT
jgi:hypothetical protein